MIVLASGMQWAGHRLPEDAMPKRKRRPYGSGTAKYVVNLTPDERGMLQQLVRSGHSPARRLTRARVLLKADEGLSDPAVAAAVDVGVATVHRIRQRCVEEGLEAALGERPRSGAPALLSGKAQAHLRRRLQYAARRATPVDAPAAGRPGGGTQARGALLV